MEGVAFEKKQLTAQWQSSLIAMQKRDEALKVGLLLWGTLAASLKSGETELVWRPQSPS